MGRKTYCFRSVMSMRSRRADPSATKPGAASLGIRPTAELAWTRGNPHMGALRVYNRGQLLPPADRTLSLVSSHLSAF